MEKGLVSRLGKEQDEPGISPHVRVDLSRLLLKEYLRMMGTYQKNRETKLRGPLLDALRIQASK